MEREIYVPPEGPPQGPRPNPEIYAIMGEENIYKMLSDFYAELEKSPIRSLFPPDMEAASKKSAAFFVGLLGGPPLYHLTYGPPRMRARHLQFKIDEKARQIWMTCFEITLKNAEEKYGFPAKHLNNFMAFLKDFSAWMVNKN